MPDGRLLSSCGPDGTFYCLTDENKTILGVINSAGQRAGTYRYDPYGQATLVENTTAEASNPFRWIGGYQDNTDMPGGYIKLGARIYNPATGAFTQPDPEPGNMGDPLRLNAYLYSGGDPINNADPSGKWFGIIGTTAMLYSAYEALADRNVTTEEFVTFAISEGSGLTVELGCNVIAGYTTAASSLPWAGPICEAAGIAVGLIVGGALEE